MIIIPAIDLRDGKCVRLTQGKADEQTVFSTAPAEIAKKWNDYGAQRLHVVDLDGAFEGHPKNILQFKQIRKNFAGLIEFGGGIRCETDIEQLVSLGADKIILGTKAYESESFIENVILKYGNIFIAGIDAKNGLVAIRGWVETTGLKSEDLAKKLETLGISEIIYTDISRDGMLTGPNIPALKNMLSAVNIPIIASGGISRKEDIINLLPLADKGLGGVIIGKALYTGAIDLTEVLK